jgi:hypothetical protein
MSIEAEHVTQARVVADAILYEGYLLYPYRKSAQKNQARFQFGVLMPAAYGAVDPCEPTASQTEFVVESPGSGEIWVLARFLQLRRRTVRETDGQTGELRDAAVLRVDGSEYGPWDEATEQEHRVAVDVADLLTGEVEQLVHLDGGEETEDITDAAGRRAGQLVHRWDPLDAAVVIRAEPIPGPYGVLKMTVRLENRSVPAQAPQVREDGLRSALISAHLLIGAERGSFLSMTDPPEWASQLVSECVNNGTWPVLTGPDECRNLMMASPIILYDHPEIAKESAGDLFDATEIDEILTLRTMTLTDAEKAEVRMTDPRAAALMDRVDGLPQEMLDKMHGAIRYLEPKAGPVSRRPVEPEEFRTPVDPSEYSVEQPSVPWWDPGSDSSVSPETDHVMVQGVRVARGSRVIMRPGSRRADAQDLFLAGRTAAVEAVLFDVDGQVHLAVTPDSDPLLAELQRSHGRFLYFSPDEIEPIEVGPGESHNAGTHDRTSGHKEEMA